MAHEPEGARWLDGKLDPEELRSALNFPDRPSDDAALNRFRLKARRVTSGPRPVRVPSGNDPMAHAIQALSARMDEMAAAQAEMVSVIQDLIEEWPVAATSAGNVDTIVAVLQELAARDDRTAMIAAALPAVIARLATLDARLEPAATGDESVMPDAAAIDRLAAAIEQLASLVESAPAADNTSSVREFARLGDRFEAMLQRLEAGRARAAAGDAGSPQPAPEPTNPPSA